ncbi:MAG: hypothetical protein AAF968_02810 [Pseudomonadota bacterium]
MRTIGRRAVDPYLASDTRRAMRPMLTVPALILSTLLLACASLTMERPSEAAASCAAAEVCVKVLP